MSHPCIICALAPSHCECSDANRSPYATARRHMPRHERCRGIRAWRATEVNFKTVYPPFLRPALRSAR